MTQLLLYFFFFSSRRRHTRLVSDWSSDVCSSDLHARLAVPSTPTAAGVRFENGALIVVRPIVLDRDLLGTVYIRSGLDELAARMRLFGLVVLAILTGSGLLGFVVSSRLQRWIAAPILDLAHTARLVTSERNFALRATPAGGDEVGALVEDFNRMLVE